MSLREDVELYTKLSGEDGSQETIGTIGAYLRGYGQGKEDAEPHWIPVTERLPKENYLDDGYVEPSQPVLVYMSYHTCKISRYWGHRKSKGTSDYVIPDWMDLEEYEGDNVIAWMPLPEAFKGETK